MSRALILSGGGAKGAYQLPIIKKLMSKHKYDAIYGTSVGSINGILAAQKDLDLLEEIWLGIKTKSEFLKPRWHWPFKGLHSMAPLRGKLQTYTSLDKIQIPFHAAAVSLRDGSQHLFCSDKMVSDESLHLAVEASSCIPGVMVPPTITINQEEHLMGDGGLRNVLPVPEKPFIDVDVVACSPIDSFEVFDDKKLIPLITRTIEIISGDVLSRDLEQIQRKTKKQVRVFQPQKDIGKTLDFSPEKIRERIEIGEKTQPFILSGLWKNSSH